MLYDNIITRIYNQPHMIRPDKLDAICRVVSLRSVGIRMDEAAIRAAMAESAKQRETVAQRSVAVLPIVGTLAKRMGMMNESSGGVSADRIGQEFDRLMADESVGAIVFDIDSPGGEAYGIQELSDKIFAARGKKPIVAVANPEAASAAYYIASAADSISVTPSGMVGSVGVVMVHTDYSGLNEKVGAKVTYIYAAPHKTEGNENQPLSDESLAHFQSQVNAIYQQFVLDLSRNRGKSEKAVVDRFGGGRMLRAEDAKGAGMADRIETLDQTIARLAGNSKPRRSYRNERERLGLELHRG